MIFIIGFLLAIELTFKHIPHHQNLEVKFIEHNQQRTKVNMRSGVERSTVCIIYLQVSLVVSENTPTHISAVLDLGFLTSPSS